MADSVVTGSTTVVPNAANLAMNELRAENQRLTARVAELEDTEVRLAGIRPAVDGGTILELIPPERITQLMLNSFRAYLDAQDAPNYIEQVWSANGPSDRYVVIIGRPSARTPHELRQDAEADRDRLAAVIGQSASRSRSPRPHGRTGMRWLLPRVRRGLALPDRRAAPAHPHRTGGDVTEPSGVLVAGDWHGNTRWARAVIAMLPELLPGEAVPTIIHTGDFGIWPGGNGRAYLTAVHDALRAVGGELWFVDGNHEDHDQLRDAAWGHQRGEHVRLARNVVWLPRGYRWEWHGRTWLALGGATSVDKAARVAGRSWWAAEAISAGDAEEVVEGGPAEVMVTHDCPAGVPLNLPRPAPAWWDLDTADAHRELLGRVVGEVQPRWLMHGHYHLAHQTTVDLGYGPVEVTGLDSDDSLAGNYRILNVETMTWEPVP